MSSHFTVWNLRPDLLAGAAAVAVLAAFVALQLTRGIAAAEHGGRLQRLKLASVALGIGVSSAHFIVMAGVSPSSAAGYDGPMLLAALGAVLAGALLAQSVLARVARTPAHLFGAAAALATGLSVASALALQALQAEAAMAWNGMGLAAAWLLACLGSGLALAVMPATGLAGGKTGRNRSAVAALMLGATLFGADAAVIGAASLPVRFVATPGAWIGGDMLAQLALMGGPLLLVLMLLSSVLRERLRELLDRARDELRRATYTDWLTGLPNKLLFEERLRRAVHRADRTEERLALLAVNLDGLKRVNAAFGQGAGDALLRLMGQRLRGLAAGALLARSGGDEFLLLLRGNPDIDTVSQRAARLLDEMARPCTVEQHEITVTGSIGIAMYPEHGALSRLVPHAAAALAAAKHLGGATYSFFEASMVTGKRDEVELLRDLRHAIEQRQLELFYQPKIHAPSGQITGAEALLRWHHPHRGIISPLVFIPIAEHYGLIHALGNWVIEDACRQIRAWRNQGLRMRVAINLSVHQLHQADLASRIAAALQRNRLEPRVLTCEITESVAMDDSPETIKVIDQLAAVGVHLSIDDFGTGYSNLSCLRKLPAEELKIDRSFVLDLETSGDARAIVDAVVKLAQAIGLKVVAEGVETEEQQLILRQLGCHELQGFLFAKPMSAGTLAHWAMNQDGPSALDFRASLFGETRAVELA